MLRCSGYQSNLSSHDNSSTASFCSGTSHKSALSSHTWVLMPMPRLQLHLSGKLEETTWMSWDYMDEDRPKRTEVPQPHITRPRIDHSGVYGLWVVIHTHSGASQKRWRSLSSYTTVCHLYQVGYVLQCRAHPCLTLVIFLLCNTTKIIKHILRDKSQHRSYLVDHFKVDRQSGVWIQWAHTPLCRTADAQLRFWHARTFHI